MIDNILMHENDLLQQGQCLDKVLRCLEQAEIKLNDQKCTFRFSLDKFLRVAIVGKNVSPNPDKLRAIRKLPPPTDVAGVCRLLGMVNHVGHFLTHLSDVVTPMHSLLNKGSVCIWGKAKSM